MASEKVLVVPVPSSSVQAGGQSLTSRGSASAKAARQRRQWNRASSLSFFVLVGAVALVALHCFAFAVVGRRAVNARSSALHSRWHSNRGIASRSISRAAGDASSVSSEPQQELTRPLLKAMKVPELRELCKRRGYKCSGLKEELIDRILRMDARERRRAPLQGTRKKEVVQDAPTISAKDSQPPEQPSASKARRPVSTAAKESKVGRTTQTTPRSAAPGASTRGPPQSSSNRANVRKPRQRGTTADFFAMPSGLLPDVFWSCPGKPWSGGNPLPKAWTAKANGGKKISMVANVLDSYAYAAIDMRGQGATPIDTKCREISEADLSAEQYAQMLGALMHDAAIQPERKKERSVSGFVEHAGYRIALEPKFHFRGVLAGGDPYVAVTMEQQAVPPSELTFGRLHGSDRKVLAAMVGLKVHPVVPTFEDRALEVCKVPEDEEIYLGERRSELLNLTRTPENRQIIQDAPDDELLLSVSRDCADSKCMRLTYVGSAVRPSLAEQNQRKLQRVPTFGDWEPFMFTASKCGLTVEARQKFISEEVSYIQKRLGWSDLPKRTLDGDGGGIEFGEFQMPTLVLGKRTRVQSSAPARQLWSSLQSSGALELQAADKDEPSPQLRTIIFGRPTSNEQRKISEAKEKTLRDLKRFGVPVIASEGDDVVWQEKTVESVAKALKSTQASLNDVILMFGTASIGDKAESLRERAKLECLAWGDGSSNRHLASQWIDLTQRVWGIRSNSDYALQNVAIAALAKLGHIPFGIDASSWLKRPAARTSDRGIVVFGYDVCHLNDRHSDAPRRNLVHISAGTRVLAVGDAADNYVLGAIEPRLEKVGGEAVPEDVIRRLLPADVVRGKIAIIHRDGRYSNVELDTFRKIQEELAGDGTSIVLVEIVKMQGGTPRIYRGTDNVGDGTVAILSPTSVILASSGKLWQGTVNPLWVRLVNVLGDAQELDDFAWARSVFDLSYLHHGSLYKAPKLPVTTYFADRLAYMLAAGGTEWDDRIGQRALSKQQFWL